MNNDIRFSALHTIAVMTDALINNATKKQSEVLFYKLLSVKKEDIAEKFRNITTESKQPFIFCKMVLH